MTIHNDIAYDSDSQQSIREVNHMSCSICSGPIEVKRHPETGEIYWDKGENAQPVNEGRCCAKCNAEVVLPARLMQRMRR